MSRTTPWWLTPIRADGDWPQAGPEPLPNSATVSPQRPKRAWQIAHHIDGATCGVGLQRAKAYVVIASAWQGRMGTGLCQQAQFPLADYELAARG